MSKRRTVHAPEQVIPAAVADALADLGNWFVIGGHAVRCFCPYRPSRDVDFGVRGARDLDALLAELARRGRVEILERAADTVHLRFEGLDVSVFVVPKLARLADERRLSVEGVLASKLHAIVDRGTRRDFFDLYVMLEVEQLGIAECLRAMRLVWGDDVNEPLLLRALTFFDDAEREAALPGEGRHDWATVREFFLERVGQLLVPPHRRLAIQEHVVDLRPRAKTRRPPRAKSPGRSKRE